MSERELATIVSSARRALERLAAAGEGDLIVSGAAVARRARRLVPAPELEEFVFTDTLTPPQEALNPRDLAARGTIHDLALPVLEQVAAEARACTKCGLCETRTHAVPGVGSARTGIVFVGEAPGADEDAKG
ncbi:MAG: hypothetical protein HOP12_12040, partial [Candidatus Eisenbacteria bacterium]|nr:hypothetical protein [Candidatus Eisenbacteria bacterium]